MKITLQAIYPTGNPIHPYYRVRFDNREINFFYGAKKLKKLIKKTGEKVILDDSGGCEEHLDFREWLEKRQK